MREHYFALLIHNEPELFGNLRRVLRELSVETYSIDSCKEAEDLILQWKPQMVFVADDLPDGAWEDVVKVVNASELPVSVIAVGAFPDVRQYLLAMEHGAFDFVTPPFEPGRLKPIVDAAAVNTYNRQQALAQASKS
jgi:DNA-binding NtrC family response regulator